MSARQDIVSYKIFVDFTFHPNLLAVQGVNTAGAIAIVQYCQSKPMFREVNHKRYLAASTTRRMFYHVTRSLVETSENLNLFKSRSVSTLVGKFHIIEIQLFLTSPSF